MDLKNFWDDKHTNKATEGAYIGDPSPEPGSIGKAFVENLCLEKIVAKGKKLLEIGVGQGFGTKDLTDMGLEVYGVDISSVALERGKDVLKGSWLFENMHQIPPSFFDIVISHCVTQHVTDETLKIHLREGIKSLKWDGIFAMQYAIPIDAVTKTVETEENLQNGSICRPIDYMNKLIDEANGVLVKEKVFGYFPDYNSGWMIVHIRRKK